VLQQVRHRHRAQVLLHCRRRHEQPETRSRAVLV
jgi:hypothetical protein